MYLTIVNTFIQNSEELGLCWWAMGRWLSQQCMCGSYHLPSWDVISWILAFSWSSCHFYDLECYEYKYWNNSVLKETACRFWLQFCVRTSVRKVETFWIPEKIYLSKWLSQRQAEPVVADYNTTLAISQLKQVKWHQHPAYSPLHGGVCS